MSQSRHDAPRLPFDPKPAIDLLESWLNETPTPEEIEAERKSLALIMGDLCQRYSAYSPSETEPSPASRSADALPSNIRRTLEESNLPIEVATAIADRLEARQPVGGEAVAREREQSGNPLLWNVHCMYQQGMRDEAWEMQWRELLAIIEQHLQRIKYPNQEATIRARSEGEGNG